MMQEERGAIRAGCQEHRWIRQPFWVFCGVWLLHERAGASPDPGPEFSTGYASWPAGMYSATEQRVWLTAAGRWPLWLRLVFWLGPCGFLLAAGATFESACGCLKVPQPGQIESRRSPLVRSTVRTPVLAQAGTSYGNTRRRNLRGQPLACIDDLVKHLLGPDMSLRYCTLSGWRVKQRPTAD